jgi:hypothetical protein
MISIYFNPLQLQSGTIYQYRYLRIIYSRLYFQDLQISCCSTCRMNKQMTMDTYCVQSMRAMRNVNLSEERGEEKEVSMVGW